MSDLIDRKKILEALGRPFTAEAMRTNSAKGLQYIPISEVIARLNSVLGFGWEFSIDHIGIPEGHPKWVVCQGTLTITLPDGAVVHRSGCGGQWIKPRRNSEEVLDLGDEYKGAASDALKKAAQSFGVGLDLARNDDAIWAERLASRPSPSPVLVAAAKGLVETLGVDGRSEAKAFWKQNFSGTLELALDEELESFMVFCNSLPAEVEAEAEVVSVPVEVIPEGMSEPDLLGDVQQMLAELDEALLSEARSYWKSVIGGKLETAEAKDLNNFMGFLNILAIGEII